MDLKNQQILVTGGAGFLGQKIVQALRAQGVPKENIYIPRSTEYDLRSDKTCQRICEPYDVVIHAAGNVGGIGKNKAEPGRLFYDNIIMGINLLEAARLCGVEKFVTIGTVCEYPKF